VSAIVDLPVPTGPGPVKVAGASAGWCRAAAILHDA
jgi:hypothetical protein